MQDGKNEAVDEGGNYGDYARYDKKAFLLAKSDACDEESGTHQSEKTQPLQHLETPLEPIFFSHGAASSRLTDRASAASAAKRSESAARAC